MRILYVIHDFFPRFYGGAERYVLNLSRQMQRAGHFVQVLTYGMEDPPESFHERHGEILFKKYSYEGVPVVSIRHQTVPVLVGYMIEDKTVEGAMESFIKKKDFDVIHIAHPMRMASCYRVGKRLNIPVVLTLTDFWLLCPRGRFFKPDYSLCNSPEDGRKCIIECAIDPFVSIRYKHAQQMFNSVDVLISPSRFLIGIFKANGWSRDILHINHGVDYSFVTPCSQRERETEGLCIGYTGVVSRFKGVDMLIRAFSSVPGPNLILKIYGDPIWWEKNLEQELTQAVEKDPRIRLMGKYGHEDLHRIFCELDVVVIPSNTLESYGLVLVESMAYDVPVIASDIVGSAYEYLQHGRNGFVFPVDDFGALSRIFMSIAQDPSILKRLRSNICLPPRLEEEAFIIESIYNQVA